MNKNLGIILLHARKLNNIGRWSNEFLHRRASVAEHSFMVAQIAQILGIIEESNGNNINWKSLYSKCLNHDIPEALMGDVISTTKNITPETKKILENVEKTLVEEMLLNAIEEPYDNIYRKIIFSGKDSSLEGKILACADDLDALIECIQEIKLSNIEPFLEKYNQILLKVKKINIYSSHYFIEKILPYLVKDCNYLK